MEKKSRRKFSSAFKSKVALEAAKGLKTINEIASSYGLQPAQVSEWKRTLLENMSDYLKEATDVTYIPMPKGHMYLFKEVSLLLPNLLMFSKKTKLRSAWMVEGEHWIISS